MNSSLNSSSYKNTFTWYLILIVYFSLQYIYIIYFSPDVHLLMRKLCMKLGCEEVKKFNK